MDFTREPIIETIVTPREGYKLTLRSSKTAAGEEYVVDAVEVVSFGRSLFYRCLERPKCFLLPVSDYEVMETKETRVVLKNATIEKSIKIAGGRKKVERDEEEAKPQEQPQQQQQQQSRGESRGGRRMMRRNKKGGSQQEHTSHPTSSESVPASPEGEVKQTLFRPLIPPPTHLISEKFKKAEEQQTLFPGEVAVREKPVEQEAERFVDQGRNDPAFPGFITEGLPHKSSDE